MKVLLIGSYPPPLGGVSVFLQRYKSRLERDGHSVDVVDPTNRGNFRLVVELVVARARNYDLISLHYPSVPLIQLLTRLGLAKNTEYWDHNWRVLEKWNRAERQLVGVFLKACREVILVSPDVEKSYGDFKVELPVTRRIQDAFIPPSEEDEQEICESYPEDVKQFVVSARPFVVANAFKLVIHEGVDLYGLDMCVALITQLKKDHSRIGLLFALGDIGDEGYYDKMCKQISGMKISENFHFLTGQKEFWPLLKRADLMVRPTATDGFAVSVAEALHFKCPTVASDVATRPEGTVLFKSRDTQDLIEKCLAVLASHGRESSTPAVS